MNYIMSLEQMLEACGDDFNRLWLGSGDKWYAKGESNVIHEGATPYEAVHNLLLELQGK